MTLPVGFRSARGPVLIAIMCSLGLVAIDTTILAAAIPTIVKDLGGFAQFPWLFSSYLLAAAVTVPVYAKFSDMIGRKPVILFGITVFLLGSILCGIAWSMPALIAFRAVQGLGAGAVQPMAQTVVGDIYTVAERAKVQGYIASVFATGAVLGPAIGGLFAQLDLWRLIFFFNVPICIVAGWLLIRHLHESIASTRHRIDYVGAVLLTVALSLLILAVIEGGHSWSWYSLPSLGAFGVGAALLVIFVFVERRAAEPILPMWLFSRRLLLTTALLSVAVGAIPGGIAAFTPLYLEVALGVSPLIASIALFSFAISWSIAASACGYVYLRIGFRATSIIGASIAAAGLIFLVGFALTPMIWLVVVAVAVVGAGVGLIATPALVAAQSSVPWNQRGVASGTLMFARSIGNAVGVAIFGAIAAVFYAGKDATELDPGTISAASGAVYLGILVVALGAIVAGIAMPRTGLNLVED